MTQFNTLTDFEKDCLRRHGLDAVRPSQLSDAFVLGLRYMMREEAVLTDDQIQSVVFAALKKMNVPNLWERYTLEHGPYSVSRIRSDLRDIIRSALLAQMMNFMKPDPSGPSDGTYTVNRYCRVGMCVPTDKEHEPNCPEKS